MNDEPRPPEERGAEVLTALPRSRPHRRSSKRPTAPNGADTPAAEAPATVGVLERPDTPAGAASGPAAGRGAPTPRRARAAAGAARPERLRQPPQPRGLPPKPDPMPVEHRDPSFSAGTGIVATAVQAAAELAEIGVTVSARMLRRAVSRLPRP
jgi:hypothetical protein